MFKYLIDLLVSNTCYSCERELIRQEQWVCFHCLSQIEQTQFHLNPCENELYYRLAGHIPLGGATALFVFDKKGRLQKLIQALKYQDAPQLGYFLGRYMGEVLGDASFVRNCEVVVPVPLHFRKKLIRGYNQAACIARGLSEVLAIPCEPQALKRVRFTQSQTRKQSEARWTNVQSAFECTQALDRHVLLVDDVITTGATLHACGQALMRAAQPPRSLAVAGLAMARRQ